MSDDQIIGIRSWTEGDDLKLLEVFGDPGSVVQHADRAMLGPDTDEPLPFGRGLVATVAGGLPIAAGALRYQRVHPDRLWVYIETAPSERNRGIATKLLAELGALDPEQRALKARSVAGDEATAGFLRSSGFQPINTSRRILLGAGALPRPALSEDGSNGYVLEDLATGSVELSQLVADYYVATHQAWDRAEMSLTRAQQLLLAPETGAVGAVVLRDKPRAAGGTIQSFAVSYLAQQPDSDEQPVAEVLFGANPELDSEQAAAAVSALVAMVTASGPVIVELDEFQPALAPVIMALLDNDHASVETESIIWATDGQPAQDQ